MKFASLLLALATLTTFGQSSNYKLTAKDTILTCALTHRSTVAGPFSDEHTADFVTLVKSVFSASPFPAEPYTLLKTKAAGDLRLGKHTYDDLDFHSFLLYNVDSVSQINYKARSRYALIAILAHQAGHHSLHHFMPALQNPVTNQELQADYFSGWLMAKLNVPKPEITKALRLIAQETNSAYPKPEQRIKATELGYALGNLPREEGPLALLQNQKVISEKWLAQWARIAPVVDGAALVENTFAKGVPELILDSAGLLHYKAGTKNYVIARAIRSKDQRYGYLLFDNQFNFWYVQKDGTVLSADESKTLAQVNVAVLHREAN
jgi:hypothetical protein